jgi:hypothetical protein
MSVSRRGLDHLDVLVPDDEVLYGPSFTPQLYDQLTNA